MSKEHSLLFSAPMIRALLDGTKSQTRRIVKPQPVMYEPGMDVGLSDYTADMLVCPYGRPGHRIWVRETFYAYGCWETRFSAKKKREDWHFVDMTLACDRRYQYAADNPDVPLAKGRGALPGWYKRPAIFMPRAACRILLNIIGVRVERLNDCSEADALAEGISTVRTHEWDAEHFPEWRRQFDEACTRGEKPPVGPMPSETYAALWESINGAGSWGANPWVWVIAFARTAP
jgi:hypothetical protein